MRIPLESAKRVDFFNNRDLSGLVSAHLKDKEKCVHHRQSLHLLNWSISLGCAASFSEISSLKVAPIGRRCGSAPALVTALPPSSPPIPSPVLFIFCLFRVLAENVALKMLLAERGMHPDAIGLAIRSEDHIKAVRP